jgi:pilus assembly protein CpaC
MAIITDRSQRRPRERRVASWGMFILVIAIGGSALLWAQGAALPAAAAATAPTAADSNAVRLMVGRSAVVDVGTAIARVSLTSPDIADAMVTAPNQLLVHGKLPGTISMFVWDRAGSVRNYEVIVQRDLARLSDQVKQLFPNEQIDVQSNGKNIVLAGKVSNKDVIEKAINVASGYVDKREEVVTLLQLAQGAPSNQVLLHVRFAEVSRSAVTELGAALFTGPNGAGNWIGRTTTQQFGDQPRFNNDDPNAAKLVFSDFLNLFMFNTKEQVGAVIKALQSKGQFQSLAEPNLVAESGKEASFLAGGEFPIPVAQGSGANLAISVVFKEFGIRLNFTPTVNGDRIHLKVRPEVSTLDFGNGVVLNGFRIPALSTRRTETELELQNNQTFAIAGLLSNNVSSTMQKIPGIGDIPILGLLFKSKAAQKDQTELVVMITPEILPNGSYGVTNTLPRVPEKYLEPLPEQKTQPAPAPAFTPERSTAVPNPPAPTATASSPFNGPLSPSAAAAAMTALGPNAKPNTAPTPVTVAASPAAAPASAAAPAAAPVASAAKNPAPEPTAAVKPAEMTKAEAKARAEEAKAKAEEDKRLAKQAEADRKTAEKEREEQEKLAREHAKQQARVEAELAKKSAELEKKAAIEEQKREIEEAKRQGQADKNK